MPYYGDYYRTGDPGLFSFVKKAVFGVAKTLLPGPVRTAFDIGSKLLGGARRAGPVQSPMMAAPAMTFMGPTEKRAAPRQRARAKPRRRVKRKLKFGSPAWRRKYMR